MLGHSASTGGGAANSQQQISPTASTVSSPGWDGAVLVRHGADGRGENPAAANSAGEEHESRLK